MISWPIAKAGQNTELNPRHRPLHIVMIQQNARNSCRPITKDELKFLIPHSFGGFYSPAILL